MPKPDAPLDDCGLPVGRDFDPDWEVTPRAVKAMRDAGEAFTLLDVRRPDELATAAIGGTLDVEMSQLEDRLDELAPLKDQRVVVTCHAGGRSLRVTQFLREQGFTDVHSMAGGIDVWARDIDPTIARY